MSMIDESAMLQRGIDDPDESTIYCELGPFNDPKAFLLCNLDRRESPPDAYSRGIYKLLRLFIDWIPLDVGFGPKTPGFVLSHRDLDIQNVIVTADGTLVGLIDSEGGATVPRAIGNERYPSWADS